MQSDSGVVVAMLASYALRFLEDPSMTYASYEALVGAGARAPAATPNDRQRRATGALLFGSFAHEITYGVLSLDGRGLRTYGRVFCRLRDVAIKARVSFLDDNSFVVAGRMTPTSPHPLGRRSVWDNRHELALARFGERLSPGQDATNWASLMVVSDGQDRGADEFIEAHIFGGFDAQAIESLSADSGNGATHREKVNIRLALGAFEAIQRMRGEQ